MKGLGQGSSQPPSPQSSPTPQVFPHAPQFAGSWSSSAQYKSPSLTPQVSSGAPQLARQLPPEQTSPTGQALPQPPQLVLSVSRSKQRSTHLVSLTARS